MKSSIFLVSSLLIIVTATEDANQDSTFTAEKLPDITLPYGVPISIGEVRPANTTSSELSGNPSLRAWLPTSHHCTMSDELTEFSPFSVGESDPIAPRIDDLVFSGYSSEKAEITRKGKKFAQCSVGPKSVMVGVCEGLEGEELEVWTTWTCYVNEGRNKDEEVEKIEEEEKIAVPPNVAEIPEEFQGQAGTYQKWECDEKGCKPKVD